MNEHLANTLSHNGAILERPAPSPEVAAFDQLRLDTYARMGQDISQRLITNPVPTHNERLLGTYVEALEPQVRNATLTMRQKGYNTTGSGFHGTDDDWRIRGVDNPLRTDDPSNRRGQVIEFRESYELSGDARARLTEMGVEMLEHPGLEGRVVGFGFTPESPDLASIESQWDAVATALPDLGTPAGPTKGTLEATNFGIYCPPDIAWPMEQFNAAMGPALMAEAIPLPVAAGIGGIAIAGGGE